MKLSNIMNKMLFSTAFSATALALGVSAIGIPADASGARGNPSASSEAQDTYLDASAETVLAREAGRMRYRSGQRRHQMMMTGSFVVTGEASPLQNFNYAKLVPCRIEPTFDNSFVALRKSCDLNQAQFVEINQEKALPAGAYLLGVHNTIYPGFVFIRAGEATRIDLVKLPLPQLPQGGEIRVFRDLNDLNEQMKVYLASFAMDNDLFVQARFNNEKAYLIDRNDEDDAEPATRQATYSVCERTNRPEMTARGSSICRALQVPNFMTMSIAFDFKEDGRYTQWEVATRGGYASQINFGRMMVALPASAQRQGAFINVLPGAYKIETRQPNKPNAVAKRLVGQQQSEGILVGNFGQLPEPTSLAVRSPQPAVAAAPPPSTDLTADTAEDTTPVGSSCQSARMWRTEWRSHCTTDDPKKQLGCSRAQARMCEPMITLN